MILNKKIPNLTNNSPAQCSSTSSPATSLESQPASFFHRGNGALRSAMRAAINLALDLNITTAELGKIGTGDKWLRQASRKRLPAPYKFSPRRSLIRRRQSPVGLRIRLHKKNSRDSLAASKPTAAQRRLLLRPSRASDKPTHRPKSPFSCVLRNDAHLSLLVVARKVIPF